MNNSCWNGFRVWCQKVLPLVYDDSLSYYEVLCKTLKHLDEFAKANEMLESEFNELKNFVDNYFNNLNVQTEINNKLDAMLESGELANIVKQHIDTFSFWNNKKIVVYGDSLSAPSEYSYWNFVKEYCPSCNITNRAIGGTCLTPIDYPDNSGIRLMERATDLNNFDVIVLAYGTNDWTMGAPLFDNETTTNCIVGAVKGAIKNILEKNPNIQIVFITPFYQHLVGGLETSNAIDDLNRLGTKQKRYNDIIINTAKNHGCLCVDLYSISGCNKYNYKSLLQGDRENTLYLHQKIEFSKKLAKLIVNNSFTDNIDISLGCNKLSNVQFEKLSFQLTNDDFLSIPNKFKQNPYIKFINYTADVGFICKSPELIITGYTTNKFNITIGDNKLQVARSGYFEIYYPIENAESIKISLNSNATTIISNLCFYGDITYPVWGNIEHWQGLDGKISITFNGGYTVDKNVINFTRTTFKALQEIPANTQFAVTDVDFKLTTPILLLGRMGDDFVWFTFDQNNKLSCNKIIKNNVSVDIIATSAPVLFENF